MAKNTRPESISQCIEMTEEVVITLSHREIATKMNKSQQTENILVEEGITLNLDPKDTKELNNLRRGFESSDEEASDSPQNMKTTRIHQIPLAGSVAYVRNGEHPNVHYDENGEVHHSLFAHSIDGQIERVPHNDASAPASDAPGRLVTDILDIFMMHCTLFPGNPLS